MISFEHKWPPFELVSDIFHIEHDCSKFKKSSFSVIPIFVSACASFFKAYSIIFLVLSPFICIGTAPSLMLEASVLKMNCLL
jgi:hypothetical protein